MGNQYIGCCGLNCETCAARIATIQNDATLKERTAALWTKLNGITITPNDINCVGYRYEGPKTPFWDTICPIRKCVQKKRAEYLL